MECVILAAGSSRRLGVDKSQIKIGSITLVNWLADRLSDKSLDITVVTNEENFEKISEDLPNANVIVNKEPFRGRTGSLKVGISNLDSIKGKGYKLLVVPVDRPGFSDSTLEQMINSEVTCCPMKKGRGGHPLLLSPRDVEKVRGSEADLPLRDIVSPSRFEVSDEYLNLNIDTPQDVENISEKLDSVKKEN